MLRVNNLVGFGASASGGAITKVGSDVTNTYAEGVTGDTSLPTGLAQNDVVVVFIACDRGLTPGTINTAGYSSFGQSTSQSACSLYTKRMGASPDSVVNITAGSGAGDPSLAVIVRAYRNVDTTTLSDATPTTATSTTGLPDPASLTTVTAGAMRIVAATLKQAETGVTAPSGWSDVAAQATDSGGATAMIATLLSATAGAVDPGTFGGNESSAVGWDAVHSALRPAT